MARPKKQPAERRTVSLSCRVTLQERLRIDAAAARAGLSPSEYVCRQAPKGRVTVAEKRTLDPAVFDQIRRIGVNLNQLTRLAHRTGRIPAQLARTAAAVERVIAPAQDILARKPLAGPGAVSHLLPYASARSEVNSGRPITSTPSPFG